MAQSRNLFRITRFVLLKIPSLFRLFSLARTPEKRLLIIKTDAIGDYILFRNFIEVIYNAEKYKDYQIDLLGNNLWQPIALNYDASFINQFFFINPDELYHSPLKTIKLGWHLFKKNYEIVLQPTYARTLINDGLAGLTAVKQIIGFEGDTERIAPKYKVKTDRFYTERIPLAESVLFEFDRSRFFFETVLMQAVELYGPLLPVNQTKKNGVVIFPGAGVGKRSWEAEKFLTLIRLINQQTKQPVYLAGSAGELEIGDYIEKNLTPQSVTNLINKTSLIQLVGLISDASLIISNETSAIHIAAATQTNAVCIMGGGHFERFAPYPEYMENKPVCVYKKMECYSCNWSCKFTIAVGDPYPCLAEISVASVWQQVQSFIAAL